MKRIVMKHFLVFIWSVCLFFASCKDKDADFYKSQYLSNKGRYQILEDTLNALLSKSDSIYKYTVNYTGKRLEETSYINDSTIHDFENVALSNEDEATFDEVMYNQDLKYVIVYRDSTKYVFSGRHQDIIVKYKTNYKPHGGILIDTNTYLFFEGTRGY